MSLPDPEAAELYGLDLDQFIPARRELAQRLRAAGERERAEAVSRLAKPTLVAWAVNRAARRRPESRDALLRAGEALRGAQERLLAGEGPGPLQDASAAERGARADLLQVVDEVLDEAERGSPDVRRRAGETLAAAATDPEVAEELREACLTREHVPISLGGFALDPGPAPPASRAPAPRPKKRPATAGTGRDARPTRARAGAAEAARAELAAAEEGLRAATAERERREEAARAAAEGRATARSELERAETALRDGMARLQAARQEAAARERAAAQEERTRERDASAARAAEARAASRQRAAATAARAADDG